jgi:hypothetical protein
MRYLPRLRLRRVALSLVAVVALAAASFATLSFTSGDVAQATDDWTAGHTTWPDCVYYRQPHAFAYLDIVRDISSHGFAQTQICWDGNYNVNVQGYAADEASDGYCATDRIRYKIKYNGVWSDWHYRNMATDCGADPPGKSSTIWWSNYPTTQLSMQACLRDGSTGPILTSTCSDWA